MLHDLPVGYEEADICRRTLEMAATEVDRQVLREGQDGLDNPAGHGR